MYSKLVFSFKTSITKENIFSEKNCLEKKTCFNQNMQISGIFKKSVLDFKHTGYQL